MNSLHVQLKNGSAASILLWVFWVTLPKMYFVNPYTIHSEEMSDWADILHAYTLNSLQVQVVNGSVVAIFLWGITSNWAKSLKNYLKMSGAHPAKKKKDLVGILQDHTYGTNLCSKYFFRNTFNISPQPKCFLSTPPSISHLFAPAKIPHCLSPAYSKTPHTSPQPLPIS